jgi:hypothetical protein
VKLPAVSHHYKNWFLEAVMRGDPCSPKSDDKTGKVYEVGLSRDSLSCGSSSLSCEVLPPYSTLYGDMDHFSLEFQSDRVLCTRKRSS